jgi:hypothetical protein
MSSLELIQKRNLWAQCLQNLEKIQYTEEDDILCSWWVRDINTPKNNEWFLDNYSYLRSQFTLPLPSRKPQKITSQTLAHIAQQCMFDFKKRTRCYMLDMEDGSRKKTTSFYVDIVNKK